MIGVLLVGQFGSGALPERSDALSEIEDTQSIRQTLHQNKNDLQNQVFLLNREIQKHKNLGPPNIKERLQHLDKELGKTNVSGSGIEIVLTDIRDSSKKERKEQVRHLQDLVNILWILRAEALSINGERVIANTPILELDEGILINAHHTSSPFHIQAIGDSEIFLHFLETKEELKKIRERKNFTLDVNVRQSIIIPPYQGSFSTKFIK